MRLICPFHSEKTPSLIIYGQHYKCYGCGRSGNTSELPGGSGPLFVEPPKVREDLSRSLQVIKSYPKADHRGFSLHATNKAFYLIWPGDIFYKRRLLEGEPKYRCPSGHQVPLFVARAEGDAVVIVEGEFNALSIAKACPGIAVLSPGGANHFESDYTTLSHLTRILSFSKVLIVADKDPAGAKAIAGLYKHLKLRGRECMTLLMDRDANEVMLTDGEEKLREIIRVALEGTVAGST